MSNAILDQEAGSELFSSYETEMKIVLAELSQKLEQEIPSLTGEARKAALSKTEHLIVEAKGLRDQMRIEKQNIPSNLRTNINTRFRNYSTDVDDQARELADLKAGGKGGNNKYGERYTDSPDGSGDAQLEQRQQLLNGTARLERSSNRLRDSQRVALETEEIGRNTLADLGRQRETIQHTRDNLLESEGYTDRSIKTLRGMARRMATNRLITIAIITVLVLLIIAVIVSKFR
ncbi:V-snare-domain-containing protein [Tothia fuscella]|uniref:V-snare-domain-containing protein n=1 Tax=Tothia fuscella TaxID=1048955 RepID=A0A9P4NDQ0_9PEZI|nr:V-snare-domain-containing protein [Tothia fuscella]